MKPRRKGAAVSAKQRGIIEGYRSGLEDVVAKSLRDRGVEFTYEEQTIQYTKPVTHHKYRPDFVLKNGIIVETKGVFDSDDRKKHLLVKQQHPELDIRFVFTNSKAYICSQKNKEFAAWLLKEKGISCKATSIPRDAVTRWREDFLRTLSRRPSTTTYADWCDKHGFKYADKDIPQEWIDEHPIHHP